MRDLTVRLQRRFDLQPQVLWDLVTDPRVALQFQSGVHISSMSGTPGTLGFVCHLRKDRGGREDRMEVVEADPPWLLRERITSDLMADRAPGELVHPSAQLTRIVAHDGGSLLTWEFTTPAPWYARAIVRWSCRRQVTAIFDGIAAQPTMPPR